MKQTGTRIIVMTSLAWKITAADLEADRERRVEPGLGEG